MNRQRGRPNYYTSGVPCFCVDFQKRTWNSDSWFKLATQPRAPSKNQNPHNRDPMSLLRLATGDYIVATHELFKIFILCIQWPILTAPCSLNTEEILITLPGNQAAGNNLYEPNSEQLCILQWVGRYCGINNTPSSSRYKVLSEVSNAHFAESWGLGLQHGSKNSSLLRMS